MIIIGIMAEFLIIHRIIYIYIYYLFIPVNKWNVYHHNPNCDDFS